jgi:chemotaxis protein MotA
MSQLLGLSGIAFAIWYVIAHPAMKFHGYWDPAAVILLGIGPPSVVMLSHTLTDLFVGVKLLWSSMFSRHHQHQAEIIDALTRASQIVRTDGLGALVPLRDRMQYDMLRDGFSLIINDFKPEEIRHNLMARINAKQSKMALAASLFENMSKLCPGMGMIGTLMGLIAMLSNMNDPSKLGSGMALALITTLYGLMLGTIIYGPWGEKIHIEAEKILEIDLMVLEGVINIKSKKSSVHMRDIMKTYASKTGAPQPTRGAS